MDDSITVEILKDIRKELQTTRDTLHQDLSDLCKEVNDVRQYGLETRDELRQTREQLVRRQTESEIRISSEIVAVASAVGEVRDLLRDAVRNQLHDHERRITALEKKSG